jgi:hypothetical protein
MKVFFLDKEMMLFEDFFLRSIIVEVKGCFWTELERGGGETWL